MNLLDIPLECELFYGINCRNAGISRTAAQRFSCSRGKMKCISHKFKLKIEYWACTHSEISERYIVIIFYFFILYMCVFILQDFIELDSFL